MKTQYINRAHLTLLLLCLYGSGFTQSKIDSLEKVLDALRPHTPNRLHVVFGCGGDRDRGKRPLMGAVAVKLADDVIVTDDNPRSEEPATIRAEILAAAKGAREIGDRAAAIRSAKSSRSRSGHSATIIAAAIRPSTAAATVEGRAPGRE